jgi:hypothetical protein
MAGLCRSSNNPHLANIKTPTIRIMKLPMIYTVEESDAGSWRTDVEVGVNVGTGASVTGISIGVVSSL